MSAMTSISAFSTTALLFLTLCCRTGSLLTVIPTNQIVEVRNSAEIECHYGTCPGLSWQGPAIDIDMASVPRYTVSVSSTMSVLTISPLVEQDEGEYYCTCTGRRSGPSNLIVNHQPSIEDVVRNQTFHRGETVAVECNANRGDPLRDLIWVRNGNKVLPGAARMRVNDDPQTLTIEAIDDSDVGLYKCVLTTTTGRLEANITVNVIDPPDPPMEVMINPDLPRSLPIVYGEPLRLDCRSPLALSNVHFSWISLNNEVIANSHLLEVAAEDVTPGVYRCLAYSEPGDEVQHTVIVTVLETPPILLDLDNEITTISAMEQEKYFLRKEFGYRLDRSNLSVEWKLLRNGEVVDFDFDSRFTFSISQTILRFCIDRAELTDRGQYLVNVSNQYGYAELRVNVNVMELTRTEVQVQISGIPCDLTLEYEQTIASQTAAEYECSFCGTVRAERHVRRSCGDDVTSLTVILLSQDTLPQKRQVSLRFAEMTVEADVVCTGGECILTTPTVPPPVMQRQDNMVIISVVVVLILTFFALVLVLLLTFLIRRVHYCRRHKHRVGQEEGGPDQQPGVVVLGDPADMQPECIAYARVHKPPAQIQSSADPAVTPVTLPYTTQPPHIAPTPLPPSSKSTTKAKRPERLYFRSHSYHGSTRTPQA